MKLSYFELLSPDAVYIHGIGSIISPKLKDISSIGINKYQYYLSVLLLDVKTYFTMTSQLEQYEKLSDREKIQIHVLDLLIINRKSALLLQEILNFFIKETVIYSDIENCYFVYQNEEAIGKITRETYSQVCDLICQRNCIKPRHEEDLSKIKSKKALEIIKKLQKGRSEKSRHTKTDENMELGNIISAVANKSHSLNILNIWNLTIFQIWDCFSRLSNNNLYDIQSMSVATWGNKDNFFDTTAWFKKTDNSN